MASRKKSNSRLNGIKGSDLGQKVGFSSILLFAGLWAACLLSALKVVHNTYESRKYIQSLQSLRAEAVELKIRSGRFQLEKSALASYPRIEKIATEELSMHSPGAGETILVVRE